MFRNVPYAAPPFGVRRFLPPVPPEKWDGVRDGRVAGAAAPQPINADTLAEKYFNPPAYGEDCLTLEVWTPDVQASLPVMVWIHGGAYLFGVGSAPAHSGRTFARDGIVHVAINYRLGPDGFLPLESGAENLGLRDQVAALEWVQRNIAAFGGDPDNVTIFGQSGGAVSVMNLMAMPAARGLFKRAIAQSGSPLGAVPLADGETMTKRFAKLAGVAPTRDALAAIPLDRLTELAFIFGLNFVKNPIRNGASSFMLSPFRALSGTPSLPDAPLVAAAKDAGVPLLTGTTRNESYDFVRLVDNGGVGSRIFAAVGRRFMGGTGRIARAYRKGPRAVSAGVPLLEAVWTDWAFRIPTIRLAEVRRAPTWLYEFRWESPNLPVGLGSPHTIEIPFVRDDLVTPFESGEWGNTQLGSNPPEALAHEMHAAWVRFAKAGDPGWARYETSDRQTMIFDTQSRVAPDAAAVERRAWAGRR